MALNFPSNPTNGQTYSEAGLSWVYDAAATAWGLVTLPVATATVAEYRNNTPDKYLKTNIVWSAADAVVLTDAATIAVDLATFINAQVTLTGNRTLGQPANVKSGQSGTIRIIQDGTGNRTLAYHADWVFAGGTDPVLSTGANAYDVLFYKVLDNGKVLGSLQKALS